VVTLDLSGVALLRPAAERSLLLVQQRLSSLGGQLVLRPSNTHLATELSGHRQRRRPPPTDEAHEARAQIRDPACEGGAAAQTTVPGGGSAPPSGVERARRRADRRADHPYIAGRQPSRRGCGGAGRIGRRRSRRSRRRAAATTPPPLLRRTSRPSQRLIGFLPEILVVSRRTGTSGTG
jgi:hypothetical protein